MKVRDIKAFIRDVPDFPRKGILFKDITTLIKNKDAFNATINMFYDHYRGEKIDVVVAIEARGFIFGGALAYRLGCGFVPIRKPHKLPSESLHEEYQLEYGKDALEIHTDAIQPGLNVLILDDLLATGGTINAACKLVEKLGGVIIGLAFLIELTFLKGRESLKKYEVYSMISCDSEKD
ncbi:MAG: adenine phosphoribosyltransferase [Bacteroidota bacterium]